MINHLASFSKFKVLASPVNWVIISAHEHLYLVFSGSSLSIHFTLTTFFAKIVMVLPVNIEENLAAFKESDDARQKLTSVSTATFHTSLPI